MRRTAYVDQRATLIELQERTEQASKLLAARGSMNSLTCDASMSSRAKFLNAEIERLSAHAEIGRLDELIESIENKEKGEL